MSLVTLGDKAKAMQMVGLGSASHDRLLLSLAQQTMWTHNQRSLVDRMWRERQQWNREAAMQKQTGLCVGIAVMCALMAGCAATYEKRFTDHEGRAVVITEQHEPDWWNNFGTPDWMNVRRETITYDGKAVADRQCTHEPTAPTLLDCR